MDLETARTQAQQGTERVATLEQNAPEMLRNLKSNLTSIFSKDNPLIQQREQALSTFLAAPSAARASTLPANLPQVAGSNLNLSPTQLASVEQGRTAAAFAPLASLNNLIVGQYGNIGDILGGAASTYEAQVNAARTRAAGALDLYRQLVGEEQFNKKFGEDIRQFNETIKIRREENARANANATDKRTQGATDDALAAMQENISAAIQANPDADVKDLVWQWIHANEPYFGSQGVDSSKLWDVYQKTPSKPKPQETKQGGGGLIGDIVNWFK